MSGAIILLGVTLAVLGASLVFTRYTRRRAALYVVLLLGGVLLTSAGYTMGLAR